MVLHFSHTCHACQMRVGEAGRRRPWRGSNRRRMHRRYQRVAYMSTFPKLNYKVVLGSLIALFFVYEVLYWISSRDDEDAKIVNSIVQPLNIQSNMFPTNDHVYNIQHLSTKFTTYNRPTIREKGTAEYRSTTRKRIVATRIPPVNNDRARILFWNKFFSESYWELNLRPPACPSVANLCEFTNDRSLYNRSQLVLFHMGDQGSRPEWPLYRLPLQQWVFGVQESPLNSGVHPEDYAGMFNLTMTYRIAADIYWPYGACERKKEENVTVTSSRKTNYALGKKHLIAWFVSHCNTHSHRELYVRALRRYANVHTYGYCGEHKCPRSKSEYCYRGVLAPNYKFYLSFENSLCNEYVTEKLWNILQLDIVPVVLGGAKYAALLPVGSYIDARDFDSPKALVDYLLSVDKNDTRYNEYFAWKKKYRCGPQVGAAVGVACRLCELALRQRDSREIKSATADLRPLFDQNSNCQEPRDVYRGLGLLEKFFMYIWPES